MPQTHLTPKDAAHLAQVVYGGLKQEDPRQILARYGNEIGSSFSPASGTIDGKTGAVFKRVSNFAIHNTNCIADATGIGINNQHTASEY